MPREILFFCDESSQVKDEWCAVAGLAMPRQIAAAATKDLQEINTSLGRDGEVKWSKAKSFGGKVQRRYIEYLFDQIDAGRMHFHIRFTPMNEYDHNLSGDRKRLDTVSKSFYQLFLHRAVRLYGREHIHIIADDGCCTSRLPEFHGALDADSLRYGFHAVGSVKSITQRSSDREPMLQLLDVTLGALTAKRNGRDSIESMGVKKDLMELALDRSGLVSIAHNTQWGAREFTCWNVRPKMRGPST